MKDSKHHIKLTAQERDLIAIWKGGGLSLREIARRLGRSHSTVIDEIRRNKYKGRYYIAIHAQQQTDKRKTEARRRHPLKDPMIYSYVLDKLRRSWSPEQIAGRLRKRYGRNIICHETIYSFIYSDHPEAIRLKLWEYLPRKQKKRRKIRGRKVQKQRIPDRIPITQRPKAVDNRTQIGHWEGDSMEGKKKDKNGLHLELERLSRKLMDKKLSRISAAETIEAQFSIFSSLPENLRRTATFDNGLENVKHKYLKTLDIDTYFTKGYSAWQKGAVENAIGLIRRYLPKGTSLNNLTQEELDDIIREINNRPRKVLNYNTPNEVFNSYLKP
jgi:IS30 family transposase